MVKKATNWMVFLQKNNIPYVCSSDSSNTVTIYGKDYKVNTVTSWIGKSEKYDLSEDVLKDCIKHNLSFKVLSEYGIDKLKEHNILNSSKFLYHKKLKDYGLLGTWISGEKWKIEAIGRPELGVRTLTREAINNHIKKGNPIEFILNKVNVSQGDIEGDEFIENGIKTPLQLKLYTAFKRYGIVIRFGDSPSDYVKIKQGGDFQQISLYKLHLVKQGLHLLQTPIYDQVAWILKNYSPSHKQLSKEDLEYCIENNITSSYVFTFKLAKKYIPQIQYTVHGDDDIEICFNEKCLRGNRLLIQDRFYTRQGWEEILTSRHNFYSSKFEQEVEEYIKELGITNYEKNIRSIKGITELDFFLPDYNIAIECNGVYYHSTLYKGKKYHQEKTLKCKQNNVHLIHIWEDQWLNKNSIIKGILRNKLHPLSQVKIYARKCTIKSISKDQASEFLNKNHLHGYSISKYHFGLFYNNDLVSVISLSNSRKFLKSNQWELVRYASLLNTNIIGGFSKLLSFASKTLHIKECISFVDCDIYNGDGYLKIGFEFIKLTDPGYYYISTDLSHRKHRYNFTRYSLLKKGFSKSQSVDEITTLLKYRKIYNSGNLLFKKTF
jgi:hypothetical protein